MTARVIIKASTSPKGSATGPDATLSKLASATANAPVDFSFASVLSCSSNDPSSKSMWYSLVARAYQHYRPSYCDDEIVWYLVQKYKKMKPTHMMLEIGSEPVTATRSFVGLAKNITCLYPNADFCALAKQQQFPNIHILQTTLEEYTTETNIDIILAASIIH